MTRAIRVATYNVHGGRGRDGRLDPGRIAAVIRAMDVDVVGLQEVDARRRPHALEELGERTGMRALAGPTMTTAEGFYGNALLTRGCHGGAGHVDISLPPFEPRSILHAPLTVDGTSVRVAVTHFGLSFRERAHQADALGALIDATAGPLVVLGDFNEWRPRGYTLLRMHARLGVAPRARSFPARWPLLALDRIWVRPRAALIDVAAWRTPRARVASDHLPVVARIDPTVLKMTSPSARRGVLGEG